MASKDYWIDPEELSQLGQELAKENTDFENGDLDIKDLESYSLSQQLTNNEDSISDESDIDILKIGSQLAEIKKRAQKSGIISTRAANNKLGERSNSKPLLSQLISGESLVLRLNAFVRWAHSQESLTGIFISDRSGNELIESGADPVIVNSGIELAKPFFNEIKNTPNHITGPIRSNHQVIDWEGSDLTVFVTNSLYGVHVLGILSQDQIVESLFSYYREGFCLVMGIK